MGHGNKLSRKKEQAIYSLAGLLPLKRPQRWWALTLRPFISGWPSRSLEEAYREARHRHMGEAIARLQQASSEAVETLQEVMSDQKPPSRAG